MYIKETAQNQGALFEHKSVSEGGFPLWSFDPKAYFAKPKCAQYSDKIDAYGRVCGTSTGKTKLKS